MPASGTFGYGSEYAGLVDVQRLGAIVTKGVTIIPWPGNPQPRIWRRPAACSIRSALRTSESSRLSRRKPLCGVLEVPVIVNIAGHTVDEYAAVASRLQGVAGVAALEVNISCPNVSEGGMEFGVDPVMAAAVTRAVRQATELPLIVKLSPNVTDIVTIAEATVAAGADALCVANTLRGTAIDIERRTFRLGRPAGGLSGPAIKPVALHLVHRVAHAVTVPVIGCGALPGLPMPPNSSWLERQPFRLGPAPSWMRTP
jgi:dihydroorotate dehydrogenase (NAD+) catalytic subunit